MQEKTPVGQKITEVDYDTYAEGEAVLGWLNTTVSLSPKKAIDWGAWALGFLETLQRTFLDRSAEIAHIKMLLVSATNETLSANVTNSKVTLRGQNYGDWPMTLILNARVQISLEVLLTTVKKQRGAVCRETIESQITFIQSLSPGRPQPLHRYARVV